MRNAITTCQMLIRVTGLIQILLGVALWVGYVRNLVPLHMLIGLIFVLALWVLAILVWRTGVPLSFAIVTIIWGGVVLLFGLYQRQWLLGPAHWLVQTLHLLVGVLAIGLGERLTRMSKRPASGKAITLPR